jgi:hypothetical protein
VINYMIHVPVWQYVIEMALTYLFSAFVTYLVIKYWPRKYNENPIKRLSAEVTPELHAQVKLFCQKVDMTMKRLITDAVQQYMVKFEELFMQKSIEKCENRIKQLHSVEKVEKYG